MSPHDLEERALLVAESLASAAFKLRQKGEVCACAGALNADGDIVMELITMPRRMQMIGALLRKCNGVAFVLVYDGYTTFVGPDVCPACGGSRRVNDQECKACRGFGKTLSDRHEAIVTVVRTRWGFTQSFSRPYELKDGKLIELRDEWYESRDPNVHVDDYDQVFGGTPQTSVN